eukprot:c1649_g1_i1 orf=1-150(-)
MLPCYYDAHDIVQRELMTANSETSEISVLCMMSDTGLLSNHLDIDFTQPF